MSILPEVTTPALLAHPDITQVRTNVRVHDTLRGGDQKATQSDRGALILDDGGFPWVSVMSHMIFRSPFYYLYCSVMNTGDSSSRAAFQRDPFDLNGCMDALGALVSEGANSILVEPTLFVLDLVQRFSRVATYWLLLRFGRV